MALVFLIVTVIVEGKEIRNITGMLKDPEMQRIDSSNLGLAQQILRFLRWQVVVTILFFACSLFLAVAVKIKSE